MKKKEILSLFWGEEKGNSESGKGISHWKGNESRESLLEAVKSDRILLNLDSLQGRGGGGERAR